MRSPSLRFAAVPTFVTLFALTLFVCLYLYASGVSQMPTRYRPSVVSWRQREPNQKGSHSFYSKSGRLDVARQTSQDRHDKARPTLSGQPQPKDSQRKSPLSESTGKNKKQRKSTASDPLVKRKTGPERSHNRSENPTPKKESTQRKEKYKPKSRSSNTIASQGVVKSSNILNQVAEAEEKHCTPHKRFFNCCNPMTALASFQGSGNTWMRHLLEEATGYYTGSVYNDTELIASGFEGEGRRNWTVLAVKTHLQGKKVLEKYERVILLTRSPFGCLLAEFRRTRGGGHLEYPDKETYEKEWPEFFNDFSKQWQQFHEYWYSLDVPMIVVRYEDLKTDLRQQLKRMVKFLGFSITKEKLDCVVENSEGEFHRKPQKGDLADIDPFTDVMKAVVEKLVREEAERNKAWKQRTKRNKEEGKRKTSVTSEPKLEQPKRTWEKRTK